MSNIIPNGSPVKFKNSGIEATILGVCVRGVRNDNVEYEIAYFFNGERKTQWIHHFEIEVKVDNSKPMGFATSNNKPLIGKH